jgi:hypothetical protein
VAWPCVECGDKSWDLVVVQDSWVVCECIVLSRKIVIYKRRALRRCIKQEFCIAVTISTFM